MDEESKLKGLFKKRKSQFLASTSFLHLAWTYFHLPPWFCCSSKQEDSWYIFAKNKRQRSSQIYIKLYNISKLQFRKFWYLPQSAHNYKVEKKKKTTGPLIGGNEKQKDVLKLLNGQLMLLMKAWCLLFLVGLKGAASPTNNYSFVS